MNALVPAVFIASLLGSMHCAGMCGAFVAFAVAGDGPRRTLNGAYNGGRLVTYTVLGAIGGAVGSAIDLGGSLVGVSRAAAVVAGAMMVWFGIVALLRLCGVAVPRMPLPGVLSRTVARGHRAALARPPVARAAIVGLLTTLLPCGWLYAFVVTAAGTGSVWRGAVVMAVFWAGTLPVMAALGAGIAGLAGPLRRRVPVLTSLLLVCVGLWTVFGRMVMPAIAAPGPDTNLVRHVESLDAAEMPCCDDR